MRVKDIMTASVDSIEAVDTIGYAARRMAEDDVGVLPIQSSGDLVGIVTDRDIAVRAVAQGVSFDAPVARVMTESVATCSPDDDVATALALMSREQVRRLPVCEHGRVVGIVSIVDAAKFSSFRRDVADTLVDVCEPSGIHCQALAFA